MGIRQKTVPPVQPKQYLTTSLDGTGEDRTVVDLAYYEPKGLKPRKVRNVKDGYSIVWLKKEKNNSSAS